MKKVLSLLLLGFALVTAQSTNNSTAGNGTSGNTTITPAPTTATNQTANSFNQTQGDQFSQINNVTFNGNQVPSYFLNYQVRNASDSS